jgi:hypothetical protein
MFKRINHNLPDGISAESLSAFLGSLFSFANAEEKALKHTLIADLIANPYYSILAITVPTFSADDPKTISDYIVGAALFTHDNKNGTFVSTIGIADKGDPPVCSLSSKFFVGPSHAKRLSPTLSFRGKDLATFLLSTLQVLGNLGFKAPRVSPSEPFHLDCNKRVTADPPHTLHLFLQARVEVHHAYLMYVQIGFTNANANFTCTSFQNDCSVNRSKKTKALEAGYSTYDDLLRLLVLRKWIVNVWPITAKVSPDVAESTLVYDASGLLDYQYLSSALVPSKTTKESQEYTNAPYYQLLECRHKVAAEPLVFHKPMLSQKFLPAPVDCTVSTIVRDTLPFQMISDDHIPRYDIRCSMFRSVVAIPGDDILDSLKAIAAAMYTDGIVEPKTSQEDDDEDDSDLSKMDASSSSDGCLFEDRALELRLNVIAFHLRCVHFPFTAPALQNWAKYAVQEYDYLVTNDLHGALGRFGFDGTIASFTDVTADRLKWNENFKLLAARLRDPDLQVLWMDLHALQLLFYKHASPVYLAPVYETVTQIPGGVMSAYPHVPILPALMALHCTMRWDLARPPCGPPYVRRVRINAHGTF